MATTLSITSKTPTTITFSVTKTSSTVGVLSIGTGTTWEDLYTNPAHQQQFGANQSGTFSVVFTGVASNTKYNANAAVIGGGTGEVSSVIDSTLPAPAPTVSLAGKTSTSATFDYNTVADGGHYAKTIQYSLDGGTTWNTGATVTGGAAASGTFTVSGLTPDTSYTLQNQSTTTAGSTEGISISFVSDAGTPQKKVYGSVSGSAELITDLYGGSSNGAQRITKLYGKSLETGYIITAVSPAVVNLGVLTDMYYRTYGPLTFRPDSIAIIQSSGGVTRVFIRDYGSSNIVELFRYRTGAYDNEGRVWGFSSEPTPVSSGSATVAALTSPSSQQSVSRLIHQGFGHLSYN